VNAYRKALVTYTVKDLPPIDKKEVEKPEITLAELRKITPRQLLRIPDEAEIVSYIFTIDQDNGDVAESTNTGETFNEATKKLIAAANDGKLLVLDNISVVMDGRKRRIPSKIYYVKN
jgi:hypothetical protein